MSDSVQNVVVRDALALSALRDLLKQGLSVEHKGYGHGEEIPCPLCDWKKRVREALR